MESNFGSHDHDEQKELPPGFRFHPTDEELISHYLHPKVFDASFITRVIGEVDLNKLEPWDLPLGAKLGENEWYFFCVRDRKYPTGSRTNRATEMGYWKATGKDKEIYKAKLLVGMKKTLVFYKGRAPRGEKTNWIMHEFRLEGEFSINNLPKSAKGERVICRVFEKSYGGKKIQNSGLLSMNDDGYEDELDPSNLPPLLDFSSIQRGRTAAKAETSHVHCFSESIQEQKPGNEELAEGFSNSITMVPSKTDNILWFPNTCFLPTQIVPSLENLQYQDPSILWFLIDNNYDSNMHQNPKAELGDDHDYAVDVAGPVDLDCLWNH